MDHYMIRQELNPETCRLDTKQCRYVYTGPGGVSSVATDPPGPRWPPALKLELERERTKEEKEREVLHLFRCYTHTPGRSRVNPERQEEEKSGHTTAKNSAGGEGNRRTSGTNLHGETDLTKTAHTPKPHNTLRRGTQGKIRDQMGN